MLNWNEATNLAVLWEWILQCKTVTLARRFQPSYSIYQGRKQTCSQKSGILPKPFSHWVTLSPKHKRMCKVINNIPWQDFYVHIKEAFLFMLTSSIWDFSDKCFIATFIFCFSICWSRRIWGFHAEIHGSYSIQHHLWGHWGGSQVLHPPQWRLPHLPGPRRGPAVARAHLWPEHHCHVVLVHRSGNGGSLQRPNTQLHAPVWSSPVMQSWATQLAVISGLVGDFSVPGF